MACAGAKKKAVSKLCCIFCRVCCVGGSRCQKCAKWREQLGAEWYVKGQLVVAGLVPRVKRSWVWPEVVAKWTGRCPVYRKGGTIDINCCASSFVCMLSLQIFVRDQRQAERGTGGWCSLRLFVCYVYSVYSVLFYVDIIKGGG